MLYVFGAGGGAKETLEDSVCVSNYDDFTFIVDNAYTNNVRILGRRHDLIALDQFIDMVRYSSPYSFDAIVTPVDCKYKAKIHNLFPGINYIDCISGKAHILSDNIGAGFNARAFVFVGETAILGDMVKINYHSMAAHDTNIGDYTFISHNVGIGAKVNIGSNCYIYENSTILPGINIGDNAVIGAGSLVTKDVESNVVAYGTPAKLVRSNG